MVKKLFKHEMQAYTRTLIPMYLVLIGIALMGRFIQLFESDSAAYNIMFFSSIMVFIISAIVCLVLTTFFGIKRFYSNLFSCEGYLSLTLPVTSAQHIMVKNIVAVLAETVSFLMIIVSTCVLTLGEVCVEIFKAFGYIIKSFYETFGFHTSLFIIEGIVAFLLSCASAMMIYYACIAIGQRAKKNRIICAIGAYFGYYIIYQIIGTIFIIIFTVFYEAWNIEKLVEYLTYHPILSNHLFFGVVLLISGVLFTIGYVITKRTIDRKLNLE